jgi:hypothetical protein
MVATIAVSFDPLADPKAASHIQVEPSRPQGEIDPGGRALLDWYLSRAQNGDPDSQIEAARLLSSKSASSDDLIQACAWVTIAAKSGAREASRLRSRIMKRMTPKQVSEADRIAKDWKPGDSLGGRRS